MLQVLCDFGMCTQFTMASTTDSRVIDYRGYKHQVPHAIAEKYCGMHAHNAVMFPNNPEEWDNDRRYEQYR